MKNKMTALILSILTGGIGVDRFYLGYVGMGVLKLLTAGGFGILYLLDIIHIANGTLGPADGTPYEEDGGSMAVRSEKKAHGIFEDMEKAAALHECGALTDEEYSKKKADLLAKI